MDAVTPPDAKNELVDTTAFFWNVYGNGPEWAFSTQNGEPVSQLVYDMDSQVAQQLTTDPTTKYGGFMFRAPDRGDKYIFYTVANHLTIMVYEQTGVLPNGVPKFALINQITSPDPDEPYINSSEPFINCTPACFTYASMTLAKKPDAQNGITTPTGLAVTAINPDTPMFKILAPAGYSPPVQRLDPEYFITANGPYLYYNRIQVESGSTQYKNEGEWYIDMQLGVPSGSCVGSSAQGGLLPGC